MQCKCSGQPAIWPICGARQWTQLLRSVRHPHVLISTVSALCPVRGVVLSPTLGLLLLLLLSFLLVRRLQSWWHSRACVCAATCGVCFCDGGGKRWCVPLPVSLSIGRIHRASFGGITWLTSSVALVHTLLCLSVHRPWLQCPSNARHQHTHTPHYLLFPSALPPSTLGLCRVLASVSSLPTTPCVHQFCALQYSDLQPEESPLPSIYHWRFMCVCR